jgi:squalene-hopene/tetraprenyl-beta-curcumene cyclase
MSRLAVLLVLVLAGCSAPVPPPGADAPGSPEPAPQTPGADAPGSPTAGAAGPLAAGVAFLVKQQSADGAWRSDTYAQFKDGPALTPLVTFALQESADPAARDAARKGSEYLAKLIRPDGSIDRDEGDVDYPVYTASLAVVVLSHPENKDLLKARDAWLKYLLDRQLAEPLGWNPQDKPYGGWGYCRLLPRKPDPNKIAPPLIESNLSATVFALDALKAAAHRDPGPYLRAETFLRRCQNEDGGFFFIYDDPVRNKAGSPDPPEVRPTRFHSYGSTTADGVRGLLITEPIRERIEDEHAKPGIIIRGNPTPRIKGFLWLHKHFRADAHPGEYVPAHERNRNAVYYYYAASASRALRLLDVKEAGQTDWAAALAAELAKRQRPDGSWANPVELVREDEPLVATSDAVIALANCRRAK